MISHLVSDRRRCMLSVCGAKQTASFSLSLAKSRHWLVLLVTPLADVRAGTRDGGCWRRSPPPWPSWSRRTASRWVPLAAACSGGRRGRTCARRRRSPPGRPAAQRASPFPPAAYRTVVQRAGWGLACPTLPRAGRCDDKRDGPGRGKRRLWRALPCTATVGAPRHHSAPPQAPAGNDGTLAGSLHRPGGPLGGVSNSPARVTVGPSRSWDPRRDAERPPPVRQPEGLIGDA